MNIEPLIPTSCATQEEAFRAVSAAYRKLSREFEALERQHEKGRRICLEVAEALKRLDQELAAERARAMAYEGKADRRLKILARAMEWMQAMPGLDHQDHPDEWGKAVCSEICQEVQNGH